MALDPRFIGVLCYCKSDKKELINSENYRISEFGNSLEDSLIEKSLNNLGKICYHIYFFMDDESYQFTNVQLKLFEKYNVEVIFKSSMTPYSLIKKISLLIGDDDVIIFNQIGSRYHRDFLSQELVEKVINCVDSPWVFCEDYDPSFGSLPLEISQNLKSIRVSDSLEPAFISASGKLIRWTGVIMLSKQCFNSFRKECDYSLLPQDFIYEDLNYSVPVPIEALDLSLVLGSPAYSKIPFYLTIGQ